MKLVKSLLLGSAAGLAAVAGAQAADLPFRKAAPVDYVRVCDWVGKAGYFYIPGTDTCIKIGGEARFEYAFVSPKSSFNPTPFSTLPTAATPAGSTGSFTPSRLRSVSGFLGRGQIEVDARTQTAYGLLRAFARLQGNVDSGPENAIASVTPGGSTVLDKAWIGFAGLTAGRITSFFDFQDDIYNYGAIATSDQSSEVLAYTATFGGGFSATISVENPAERRGNIGTIAFGGNSVGGGPGVNGAQVGYAGYRYPDGVVQLLYSQSWGEIQLSGAYHDVNTSTPAGLTTSGNSEAGWAVQGGIHVKLPMLAAGDDLWLQGAYQEGAVLYQDSTSAFNFSGTVGGFLHQTADAVAVGNGAANTAYGLDLGKGFSVSAEFQHYFTPQFRDVLFGSYEEISYGNVVKNTPWFAGGVGDASQWKVGNQFVFSPASGLDLGIEVLYTKLDQDLAGNSGPVRDRLNAALGRPAGSSLDSVLNPDSFQVRLRVNRDF